MARATYLEKYKTDRVEMNVFLTNKAMLTGKIVDHDDECIVLNKCLIFFEQVVSITPA